MKIVGIMLLRNEEMYVEHAVRNIVHFCDELVIADHQSTDQTYAVVSALAKQYEHIRLYQIRHPRESHDLIKSLAGEAVWVFGVDGDEVYDPAGLKALKEKLRAGAYDQYWCIFGAVLHTTALDIEKSRAEGYLAPPSRSVTKLYNFSALVSWEGVQGERLHGGEPVFKTGYDSTLRLDLHQHTAWETCDLRCLHLCFIPRTHVEADNGKPYKARWNLAEQQSRGVLTYLLSQVLNRLNISRKSKWKYDRYARGALVEKDVSLFFEKT